jgi:hypothetical protein
MKLSELKKVAKTPYQSQEKIVLGAWFSPYLEEKLWKWYKEANFNEITLFPANEETTEYLDGALSYCKKYGVNAHLYIHNDDNHDGKLWTEIVKGYEDVVSGFDVYDEPLGDKQFSQANRPDLVDVKKGVEYVLKTFPDKHFTVTLWPNYACAEQIALGEGKTYEDYVKKYCEEILAPLPNGVARWIGTDFYPYYTNRFDGKLLDNLELLQFYAKQYGASVYLYVQVMDSKVLNWRYPNRNELSLQYFVALAYGVKNIQAFCYQQPHRCPGGEFGYEDGKAMITDGYTLRPNEKGEMVRGEYERTQSYWDVRAWNGELGTLSEAYMDFAWQGVMTVRGTASNHRDDFSGLRYSLAKFDGVRKVIAEENLLVGCFLDKDGKDGYMLTNYSDPLNLKASTVELDFGDRKNAIVYRGGERFEAELESGRFSVRLYGGEGVFVIPQ